MNKGLSPELSLHLTSLNFNLSESFNIFILNTMKLNKSIQLEYNNNLSLRWFSGFTSGDGSFQVDIRKIKNIEERYQVLVRFSIGQHRRDDELLRSFIKMLDCGKVYIRKSKNKEVYIEYRIDKFKDIKNKIIPLFIKYPVIGQKLLDFQDFCRVANLIDKKYHLTSEGLNEIQIIKKGMNSFRIP